MHIHIELMIRPSLTKCHECDQTQRLPHIAPGESALCARCGTTLHRHRSNSLERSLALTLAGLILFVTANSFPFLSFEMQGQTTETTLMSGAFDLYNQGRWELAAVVLFTSIVAPGAQLLLLTVVLGALRFDRLPPGFAYLFRLVTQLAPWGMMDVFLLGLLVAVVKLSGLATIIPGTSLFAFVVLIFVLAAAQSALDPELVWSKLPIKTHGIGQPPAPAALIHCTTCDLTQARPAQAASHEPISCGRCGHRLHARKPDSIQRTWALVIAAIVCYIPANLLPIMQVTMLGAPQSDTIMSGVIYLLLHGMWPLALVVFVASVFVPLLKLAILVYLLISVQIRSRWRPVERTRLYRITEAIGRWSMVDIYVVTILVALVHLGNLASIEARAGAVFFAAVVILTIFAAMTFDPRLIWDAAARSREADRRVADATS